MDWSGLNSQSSEMTTRIKKYLLEMQVNFKTMSMSGHMELGCTSSTALTLGSALQLLRTGAYSFFIWENLSKVLAVLPILKAMVNDVGFASCMCSEEPCLNPELQGCRT